MGVDCCQEPSHSVGISVPRREQFSCAEADQNSLMSRVHRLPGQFEEIRRSAQGYVFTFYARPILTYRYDCNNLIDPIEPCSNRNPARSVTESLRSAYRKAHHSESTYHIPQEPIHCSPKLVPPSPQPPQPPRDVPQREVSQGQSNNRPRFIQARAALKESLSPIVYPVTVPSTAQSLSNMNVHASTSTRFPSRTNTPRAPTPFDGVKVRAAPRSAYSAGAASLPRLR